MCLCVVDGWSGDYVSYCTIYTAVIPPNTQARSSECIASSGSCWISHCDPPWTIVLSPTTPGLSPTMRCHSSDFHDDVASTRVARIRSSPHSLPSHAQSFLSMRCMHTRPRNSIRNREADVQPAARKPAAGACRNVPEMRQAFRSSHSRGDRQIHEPLE
jgi:hypothetical protein